MKVRLRIKARVPPLTRKLGKQEAAPSPHPHPNPNPNPSQVRATMKKKEAAEKARKAGGGAPLKKSSGAKQEEAAQRKQQAELAAVERLRGALSRLDRLAGPSPQP